MDKFPRTNVGGISVSRMIIGQNMFAGGSHCTAARDDFLFQHFSCKEKIADIIEVFFRSGVDTIMSCFPAFPKLVDAVKIAEDRTGVKGILVSTPWFTKTPDALDNGFDWGEVERVMDKEVKVGTSICMPHSAITDSMIDQCAHKIRHMDKICKIIREHGMVPGLSTHCPESIVYADESGLDVETYISIYNARGFLMHLELDWTQKIIQNANKPVTVIKPLAAGYLRPFEGLNFVWNTIRDMDMVTVGTMYPKEAEECIELSLSILEKKDAKLKLQETRSKRSVKI